MNNQKKRSIDVKRIIKTIITMAVIAVLIPGCLTACGSGDSPEKPDEGSLKIVTTIFPEYDWVMNVLGDNPSGAEVTLLLDKGVDMHSFQPSAEDILKISSCDLLVYVGGESDSWVGDVLNEAVNKDMITVDLLDVLGDAAKEEEISEGMQPEDEGEDEEGPELDEHVWLSLNNASLFTDSIEKALSEADPDNAGTYQANAAAYKEKIAEVKAEYEAAVSEASTRTLLFGDRFPFRYLTDELGLEYFAAFAGCSAETEASFETITFLSGKIDELGLRSVITIDGSDQRIAETIISNTGSKDQQILVLDSMQSVTADDIAGGADYLGIMRGNLEVLKEALN